MDLLDKVSIRARSPYARGLPDRRGIVVVIGHWNGDISVQIGREGVTLPPSEVRRGH